MPVIFGAGGAWKTLKDLKGVSGKVNRLAEREKEHYFVLALAVVQALPEEKRMQYTAMLHEGMKSEK